MRALLKMFADHGSETINQAVVLRAVLFMILSALCFAVVEFTGAHLVQGIDPLQIVWTRYAVHLLFMIVVLMPRYKTTLVRTSRLPLQIIRSLTMLGMPVCFLLAVRNMPVNNVWSLQWLSPVLMLALSTWVLREPASPRQWITVGLGFGAMLLIHHVDGGVLSPAALLAVGMGLCLSLHLMLSRVLRTDHPLTSLFHTALWVFIALGFVVPFLWASPSPLSLLGMIIIGLVGALGLFALAQSGELVPLPVVAAFAYTEALWTLLLNLLVFGVLPGKLALIGAAAIFAITLYQFFFEYRRPALSPLRPHTGLEL